MTCIVGIQTPDGVLIGGDCAGSRDGIHTLRADPKVFENGPYVIGFTSSFRMGQLLRCADLPKPLDRTGDELYRFMVTEFIDAIRKILRDGGWAEKDKEQEKGGEFLVGCNGHLYTVASDYQVGQPLSGYDATGSGWEVALGALHATQELEPIQRVGKALAAAAEFVGNVRPPFTVVLGRYAKESP